MGWAYGGRTGHNFDFAIRTAWFSGGDIAAGLAQFDWSKTAVLCHHAHFDGLILAHHYGVRPALWLDTLSMARALIGNHLGGAWRASRHTSALKPSGCLMRP